MLICSGGVAAGTRNDVSFVPPKHVDMIHRMDAEPIAFGLFMFEKATRQSDDGKRDGSAVARTIPI